MYIIKNVLHYNTNCVIMPKASTMTANSFQRGMCKLQKGKNC